MPYIEAHRRRLIETGDEPRTPGELTYVLTRTLVAYLGDNPRYSSFAEVVGCLENAKLEMYRRVVAPYEDRKLVENGDVFIK